MWKNIEGYDGYKVNENGVVLNKKGHMLRQALSNTGRPRVALEVYDENGKLLHRDNMSIHRLVASAFLENPDDLPIVMHKDNDPLHNHVSNLKWGTYKENVDQCINEGRKPECHINPSKEYIVTNGEESITCLGTRGVADLIGFTRKTIRPGIIKSGEYKGYEIIPTNNHAKIPFHFTIREYNQIV